MKGIISLKQLYDFYNCSKFEIIIHTFYINQNN